jgi:putative YphP/YqiW family bacilliredoxin
VLSVTGLADCPPGPDCFLLSITAAVATLQAVPYPEQLIAPMRADLTRYGLEEARTPADVDRLLEPGTGIVLMVVNSVCGCAAGRARPGVGLALEHPVRPARAATVFAGGDEAAVARLRAILSEYPPSSPSIALFRDGKPVYVMHRADIERRDPVQIAQLLTAAFDRICVPEAANMG